MKENKMKTFNEHRQQLTEAGEPKPVDMAALQKLVADANKIMALAKTYNDIMTYDQDSARGNLYAWAKDKTRDEFVHGLSHVNNHQVKIEQKNKYILLDRVTGTSGHGSGVFTVEKDTGLMRPIKAYGRPNMLYKAGYVHDLTPYDLANRMMGTLTRVAAIQLAAKKLGFHVDGPMLDLKKQAPYSDPKDFK